MYLKTLFVRNWQSPTLPLPSPRSSWETSLDLGQRVRLPLSQFPSGTIKTFGNLPRRTVWGNFWKPKEEIPARWIAGFTNKLFFKEATSTTTTAAIFVFLLVYRVFRKSMTMTSSFFSINLSLDQGDIPIRTSHSSHFVILMTIWYLVTLTCLAGLSYRPERGETRKTG